MRAFLTGLTVLFFNMTVAAADLLQDTAALENRWAETKYEMTDKTSRLAHVQALHAETAALAARNPGRPEPLIWQALIHILEAEVHSSTASLGALREARALLEAAGRIDAKAMNGAVHANLGSLYYEVPGWPISFGDNKKAAHHLEEALKIDPEGREANYFYGDYLLQRSREEQALRYLEKALVVPIRPDHAKADLGRHKEVEEAIRKAKARLAR